jgi:hypothetical protein
MSAQAPTTGEGRELVVLADGPWARRCYWRADLEAMQQASRRAGHADAHPSAVLRGYLPTEEHQPIGGDPDRTVQVYRYTPPDVGAEAAPADESMAVAVAGGASDEDVAATPGQERTGGGRVLVTGSRTWTDRAAIRDGLAAVWGAGDRVLVTGACPTGADALAEACWRAWGGQVETHPADWDTHGRAAGPRRNTEMVGGGAQVCVAFIRDSSRGASHLAGLAEAAGIEVHRHEHNTAATRRAPRGVVAMPAPRRPLDDEPAERERLHRIYDDLQQQHEHEQTAQGGHEREGVLW